MGPPFLNLLPSFTSPSGKMQRMLPFNRIPLISNAIMFCHCKVFPGSQKLPILFGYPHELASERASRKILALLGIQYDNTLAHTTSRSTQVGHFIISKFEHTEEQLEGDPQVNNMPFKCIEGSLPGGDVTWWSGAKRVEVCSTMVYSTRSFMTSCWWGCILAFICYWAWRTSKSRAWWQWW